MFGSDGLVAREGNDRKARRVEESYMELSKGGIGD